MFKTRITEMEMCQSTSSAVEVRKGKGMKFTRFDLSVLSAENIGDKDKINIRS